MIDTAAFLLGMTAILAVGLALFALAIIGIWRPR